MLKDLAREAGKLKGAVERLKVEIEKEPLDRFQCGACLSEIYVAYEQMKVIIMLEWDSYVKGVPKYDLLAMFIGVWGNALIRDPLDADLSTKLFSTKDAIYYINQPHHYDDAIVRTNLREFINASERWLAILDREILAHLSEAPPAPQRLEELVRSKPGDLDENWLVANAYLSALETRVNKVRARLNLDVSTKENFPDRFKELSTVLDMRGITPIPLEQELTSQFWQIRNDVIQSGYNPKEQELDLVITSVKKVLATLLKVK